MHDLHVRVVNVLMKFKSSGLSLINELLNKLLEKPYYETDRTLTADIEKRQK